MRLFEFQLKSLKGALENGVGVVNLTGPLIRKPDFIASVLFGATDTDEAIAAVREAGQRPDVEAVFLDIDSPGGTVSGTPELAQAVANVLFLGLSPRDAVRALMERDPKAES